MLDLMVTPSSLFIKADVPQAAAADDGEGGEEGDGELIEMEWLCKSGLPKMISLVKEEFAKERNLRPVKILVMGPPCAGKSFYAEQIAEHYNIPHIHMEKMLQELLSWDQEKDDSTRSEWRSVTRKSLHSRPRVPQSTTSQTESRQRKQWRTQDLTTEVQRAATVEMAKQPRMKPAKTEKVAKMDSQVPP